MEGLHPTRVGGTATQGRWEAVQATVTRDGAATTEALAKLAQLDFNAAFAFDNALERAIEESTLLSRSQERKDEREQREKELNTRLDGIFNQHIGTALEHAERCEEYVALLTAVAYTRCATFIAGRPESKTLLRKELPPLRPGQDSRRREHRDAYACAIAVGKAWGFDKLRRYGWTQRGHSFMQKMRTCSNKWPKWEQAAVVISSYSAKRLDSCRRSGRDTQPRIEPQDVMNANAHAGKFADNSEEAHDAALQALSGYNLTLDDLGLLVYSEYVSDKALDLRSRNHTSTPSESDVSSENGGSGSTGAPSLTSNPADALTTPLTVYSDTGKSLHSPVSLCGAIDTIHSYLKGLQPHGLSYNGTSDETSHSQSPADPTVSGKTATETAYVAGDTQARREPSQPDTEDSNGDGAAATDDIMLLSTNTTTEVNAIDLSGSRVARERLQGLGDTLEGTTDADKAQEDTLECYHGREDATICREYRSARENSGNIRQGITDPRDASQNALGLGSACQDMADAGGFPGSSIDFNELYKDLVLLETPTGSQDTYEDGHATSNNIQGATEPNGVYNDPINPGNTEGNATWFGDREEDQDSQPDSDDAGANGATRHDGEASVEPGELQHHSLDLGDDGEDASSDSDETAGSGETSDTSMDFDDVQHNPLDTKEHQPDPSSVENEILRDHALEKAWEEEAGDLLESIKKAMSRAIGTTESGPGPRRIKRQKVGATASDVDLDLLRTGLHWLGNIDYARTNTNLDSPNAGDVLVVKSSWGLSAAAEKTQLRKCVLIRERPDSPQARHYVDELFPLPTIECFFDEMLYRYGTRGKVSVQSTNIEGTEHPTVSKEIGEARRIFKERANCREYEHALNLLDLRDVVSAGKPHFLQDHRFGALRHILESLGKGPGKQQGNSTSGIDAFSRCQSFNILALGGAFSGPHVDVLNGTWVRCLDGIKAWIIKPELTNEDREEFGTYGRFWKPSTPAKVIILSKGDVLVMPPGLLAVHAPLTLTPCLMEGGMFWDWHQLDRIFEHAYWICKKNIVSNEEIAAAHIDRLLHRAMQLTNPKSTTSVHKDKAMREALEIISRKREAERVRESTSEEEEMDLL